MTDTTGVASSNPAGLSPYVYSTAALAVLGTAAGTGWRMAATAAFANEHLGGGIPAGAVVLTFVGSEIGHVFLWLLISVLVIISMRIFCESDHVPSLWRVITLTGAAHVPICIASICGAAMWQLAEAQVAQYQLTPKELLIHPVLRAAANEGQWLWLLGVCGAIVWLTVSVTRSCGLSSREGIKAVVVPTVGFGLFMTIATKVAALAMAQAPR